MARSLGFYGDGISFWVVFGQSLKFRVFPGGKTGWMLVRGILGSGRTHGLLSPFPELFLLVVAYSVFLIRISCHKTTHANGYDGARPGWAVSISVLPLTEPEIKLPTSAGSSEKQESSRKTSISALLTMLKPLTVWITINCGKFFKRGNTRPPDLPLEKPICRSGSNS